MPPDKASKLLTICLLVNSLCLSLPRKSGLVKSSIHINLVDLLGCFIFYEAYFECHGIIMLGKSPMKLGQRPDVAIAVNWDVKHQFKQTKIIHTYKPFWFIWMLM